MIPIQKFHLEFILHMQNPSLETIKNSLAEFGEGLEITECQDNSGESRNFKININTQEPTAIFDICAQFGRIRSAKIKEDD